MKKRVLSGIRATGRLHLGNYLGAVKGFLQLQDNPEYETFYMVADVHTLTTPYDVEELRKNRREVIIDYLAAGLDPERSVIFQQAEVAEHIELAFYFSSVVTIARMQHLPTFKEKVKQHPDSATMALLNYPVLMAADILVYKAGLVPVGIDQEPHLEVARVIAGNMNSKYGTDFPLPQRFATKGEYVPSLKGAGKMSKSIEGSYINITDSFEEILSKVKSIPTDSGYGEIGTGKFVEYKELPSGITTPIIQRKVYLDRNKETLVNNTIDGVGSLMELVELFMGVEKRSDYEKKYTSEEGVKYSDLKKELAEAIYEELKPLQEKRKELEDNQEYVDKVIREGAEKARAVASKTLREVRERMGLG